MTSSSGVVRASRTIFFATCAEDIQLEMDVSVRGYYLRDVLGDVLRTYIFCPDIL